MTVGDEKVRVLSMDQIRSGLSDLALNGDGAQKTQAYRMLMSMSVAEAVLPPPLTEKEVIERLARMMRGAGNKNSRLAYVRAFPRPRSVEQAVKDLADDVQIHIPREEWPKTIKQLYKKCPELRQGPVPQGYPLGKSKEVQIEWIQKHFVMYHRDRQEADKRTAMIELEVGTDADRTQEL